MESDDTHGQAHYHCPRDSRIPTRSRFVFAMRGQPRPRMSRPPRTRSASARTTEQMRAEQITQRQQGQMESLQAAAQWLFWGEGGNSLGKVKRDE